MTRRLVDESDRADGRTVDAILNEDGDLVIRGVDWGPTVERMFERDEYEFAYTVRRRDLEAFAALASIEPSRLLDDLADKWAGDRFGELAQLLLQDPGERGFSVEFWSF